MSTYENIAKSRRLVRIGIVVGYAVALVLTVIRVANSDAATIAEILGSVALGAAMATPATLALLSLDRRPTLLPAAAIGAVVTSIIEPTLIVVGIPVAVLWYQAWTLRPVRAEVSRSRAAARVGLGFLMVASVLALFVHLDPVCTQRLADGTTRSVDETSSGLTTGWALGGGTTATSSSGSSVEGVTEESCQSDTIVLGEALASLAITGLVIEIGRRWPRGTRSAATRRAVAGAS
jgi:hypothetical protein